MKYKGITIHKRQNCNTWYTRFRKNNKVICISAKTQKECYEKLKIEYNKKEVVDIKKSITLQEWYLKWLELYKIGKVKDTTINSYKVAWKHIPDELLSTHIDKIKVEHIITTLANCKEESKAILLKYKDIPNDNRIFNISMKQHDNTIKKLKSKLPFDIKTKDMRTIFITRCTELGIPEFVIQSWVGHKIGSKVTKDSYTTHNTEIDNKYINILNQSKLYTNCVHKK